jgi:hypothetical protein
MPSPVLYSTNPWFATDVALKYRGGVHFAWVCECFDTTKAPGGSGAAMIAPSSNPRRIYQLLAEECLAEEGHSPTIKGYKKTFKRLARDWLAKGELTQAQCDEIVASVQAPSWRIWRPVLYVIPRGPIEAAGRLKSVQRPDRAGHGPEQQITDLMPNEFDVVELPSHDRSSRSP